MIKISELKFKLIQGWDTEGDDAFESWLNGITDGDDSSEEEIEPEVEEEVEEEPVEEDQEEELPEDTPEDEPDLEQPVDQDPVEKPALTAKPEQAPVEQKPVKTAEEEQAEVERFMGELQKQYALSDEDADAVLTDPKTVLPKLMANVHAMILQQVGAFIQQAMPTMVQSQVRNVSTTDQRLAEFQQMYPDLATPENQAVAMAAIKTVKQANPNIGYAEMLKKVGPVAYALLGKTMSVEKKAPAAKPKPHIPAKTSTSTALPKEKSSDPTTAFFESLDRL